MPKIRWTWAVRALTVVSVNMAAPASALSPDLPQQTVAPLVLAAAPAAAPAEAAPADGRQGAADACLAHNRFAPAGVVEAVADGMGDWLVWVEDRDGDLWACNADSAGLVYMDVFVGGDIVEGRGAEFLPPAGIVEAGAFALAGSRARDLCTGVAGLTQDVTVLATAADGLGDTLVWLRMADRQLWICNASASAELFLFEPVGFPLEEDDRMLVLSAAEAEAE